MAKDLIRYDLLVQDALKGVVRRVLSDAGKEGLSGDHHFYISFRTDFPGVRLSNRLREKYPQEMTIVLQHQFWDLGVTEHTFEVGLSFSGVPERLLIPFDALTGFFDPSVQFGLKFEVAGEEQEEGQEPPPSTAPPAPAAASEPVELQPRKPVLSAAGKTSASSPPKTTAKQTGDNAKSEKSERPAKADKAKDKAKDADATTGEVVSLDSFRKKS
jgi:hypothetical protein